MTDHARTPDVTSYLAGAGEPGDVFAALAAAGWAQRADPRDNTEATAPNGLARLVFQPESEEYAAGGPLWKVEATGFPDGASHEAITRRPYGWSAAFDADVPVELIVAFLRRLVDPAGIDRSAPVPDDALALPA
ncbi:DUF317 domain-containing protein [Streptomyces sp. H27-C3]|uniref:DUF317 domain-containing protein n=1 Tax=Streptomyces sp. H27-C3 TaxID=3046305 RepID=UPI0024B948DD|nr:DUF317 domain-containing protein [Streptomyces sp. H27-C3]MDJ0464953.1 DUF317 domain-containing protein [Streptomyces sp. H27-C3]